MQNIMREDKIDSLDKEIINYIGNNPYVKSIIVLNSLSKKINQSTLNRRLDKLIKLNFIEKEREGRNIYYIPNERKLFFSIPPHKRESVDFDLDFIKNININDNMFFNANEIEEMSHAGSIKLTGKLDTKALFLYEQFTLILTYSSSQFEGVDYNYIDTKTLLEYHQYADGKSLNDAQIILNHKEALKYQFNNIFELNTNEREIKNIHSLLSHNLKTVQPYEEGAYRERIIFMDGSAFNPLNNPYQIKGVVPATMLEY